MAGNSFGELFRVTTFGESHGAALGAVIDGCPAGMPLSEEDIQPDLDRRRPGSSKFATPRREPDQVRILSGVFEGVTTGTPIGLLIENTNQRSGDYADIMDKFRPGHADYTYFLKYGVRDYRGGGRASARETAMRVAAGAIAKKYLRLHFGTDIHAGLYQIGQVKAESVDFSEVRSNEFNFLDASKVSEAEELIRALRKEGDSVGAGLLVEASGVPAGLGEPVFGRLDADLASALMGINAVKGVEIGDGFDVITEKGSEHRDLMYADGFHTNRAGGILGGISTGQNIVARIALKPTSSIMIPGATVTKDGQETEIVTHGRHDPCVGIRAVPIAEAMVALVLMDHFLRNMAQNYAVAQNPAANPEK